MPLTIRPAAGAEYHQIQAPGRGDANPWSRAPWGLLGIVAIFLLGFAVLPGVIYAIFAVVELIGGKTYDQAMDSLSADSLTPAGLAVLNLSLAAIIPVTLLTAWLVNGLKPGFVLDVLGRVRWAWFGICVGLAVVTFLVTAAVSALVPGADSSTGPSEHLSAGTVIAYVLVIALLTPLQAAGEEFAFRGYLLPAVGAVVRSRWVPIVVSALLFGVAHGVQNAPLFLDRVAFGLVAGWLAVRTGGLESGIALHVVNNFFAFGAAVATGTIATAASASSAPWSELIVTATQSVVALALVTWAARRFQPARRVPALDFPPPRRTL